MGNTSNKIEIKQKRLYAAIIAGSALILGFLFYFFSGDGKPAQPIAIRKQFETPSNDVKPENIRLTQIEKVNDVLSERLQSIEKSVIDLKEEKMIIETEKNQLIQETQELQHKIHLLSEQLQKPSPTSTHHDCTSSDDLVEPPLIKLKVWEPLEEISDRNVLCEIPAGTVVKAVLVSGADCSVSVQKPTGPNMLLLRPLDNGKLPRNVRVALKGSVIIGNAIGDMATERVYVRTERLTLVERNGSFVETEVTGYISGEDGREGIRGVVVDRSGQIISRAAFASFLQGVSQTVQAVLNNQVIQKLAEESPRSTILDLDMYRNSAFQGGSTALSKMADYYIKRAEQLQPAIQIAAGRVVDVIFTKTVKIGEKDLKKKLDKERELQLREQHHG